MTIRKAARTAALIAGGTLMVAATPVLAQGAPRNKQAQAPTAAPTAEEQLAQQRLRALSAAERTAFLPLLQASNAIGRARAAGQPTDLSGLRAALPAAQAAARSNEAKFFVTQVQLDLALEAKDAAAQEQALTALLGNPILSPAERTSYSNAMSVVLNKRAEQAFAANDFATAERIFRQLLTSNPTNQRLINNLRIVQERQGNTAGALQVLLQQIQTAEAAGQRAPEEVYVRAWQIPYKAGQRSEAAAGLRRLLKAYPSAANWRTAFDFVRERSSSDAQVLLDAYRFARAANVVKADEYVALVSTLNKAGLPGETQAVLEAGLAAGALQGSHPEIAPIRSAIGGRVTTDRAALPGLIQQARSAGKGEQARIAADVLYGYGRYGEAAELYRLALTKGGEDASMLNLRLGASLALAGQRAEAQTALRAVTGSRAELAELWLAWLDRTQG